MPRSGARCARGDSQAAPAGGRATGSPPPPSFSEPVARLPGDTIAVVTKRDGSHMAAGTHGAVIRLRRTLKRPKMGSFARSNGRCKYRRAAVESRLAAARAGVVVSVMPDREAAVPGHAKKYRPCREAQAAARRCATCRSSPSPPPGRALPPAEIPPPRRGAPGAPCRTACASRAAGPACRPRPHSATPAFTGCSVHGAASTAPGYPTRPPPRDPLPRSRAYGLWPAGSASKRSGGSPRQPAPEL